MRRSKIGSIAVLIGAAALVAPSTGTAQAQQDHGWYIGGGAGQMKTEGNCPAGVTCDLTDTAWKVFGGYQFSRNWALEATYGDWGKISVSGGGATAVGEISSFGVAALGILPLGEVFSVFGKAGAVYTQQKFTLSGGATGTGIAQEGSEGHLGVGAMLNVTRSFGLRAEWERLIKSEVNIVSIGIQYRF